MASVANTLLAAHVNLGFHADTDNSDLDRFDHSDDIHKFEIVPGIKVNPYKDLFFGFSAILSLNREGLTTDWTPNGTAEVSYHF